MGIDVDGLIETYLPVLCVTQAVNDVMGVFGTQSGDEDGLFVCSSISIGVTQVKDFGGCSYVYSVVPRQYCRGHEETIGEDLSAVCHAIAIQIFEDDDFVIDYEAGRYVRIAFGGGDP